MPCVTPCNAGREGGRGHGGPTVSPPLQAHLVQFRPHLSYIIHNYTDTPTHPHTHTHTHTHTHHTHHTHTHTHTHTPLTDTRPSLSTAEEGTVTTITTPHRHQDTTWGTGRTNSSHRWSRRGPLHRWNPHPHSLLSRRAGEGWAGAGEKKEEGVQGGKAGWGEEEEGRGGGGGGGGGGEDVDEQVMMWTQDSFHFINTAISMGIHDRHMTCITL